MSGAGPRVAVVHDYVTQRGGAERVALALLGAFPGARLVTAAYAPDQSFPEFAGVQVETLWTDRVPPFHRDPRTALPVLARAFSRHVVDADVLVCSTSGWAHGIGGPAARVVYCHNPARWLYQVDDYLGGAPPLARRAFTRATGGLRAWDRRAAQRASLYFANSTSVQGRIAAAYGIEAEFLPPPPGLDPSVPDEPVSGLEPGFLLTVSRPRSYKNTRLVCEAVDALPGARLVVVGGLPERTPMWGPGLTGLVGVSDAQLAWLYRNAVGLVAVGREDFGLTPVESYSFGRPAAVLRAGGYVDSAAPGVATTWIEEPTVAAVTAGIRDVLATAWDSRQIRQHADRFSLASFQARMVDAVDEVWRPTR